MRRGDGTWRSLEADGAGDRKVPVSVGPDKSRKTIATEIALKRIKGALETANPTMRFWVDRSAQTITSRWQPVLRVEADPVEPPTITWCTSGLANLGLSRETLEPVAEGAVQATQHQWSG